MRYNDDIIDEIKTNNLKLKDISINDRVQLISSSIFKCGINSDIEDAMMEIGEWFDDRMCDFADDFADMEEA